MSRAEDLFQRLVEGKESAIDQLILDRQSEELFLDFKRVATTTASRHLHGDDRANFAKAISGFANSEGGVIVWGVECKNSAEGDIPSAKFPFENPKRFVSWLEGATSGCTLPPHSGVRHEVVTSSSDANKGFAITHIGKSNLAPLQVVQPQPSYYYISRVRKNAGQSQVSRC